MERTDNLSIPLFAARTGLLAILAALCLAIIILFFKPAIEFGYGFRSGDGANWSICALEDPHNAVISGTSLEPFIAVFLFFLVVVHITPVVFAIERPIPENRGPPVRLS
jgi:hypothetical protein